MITFGAKLLKKCLAIIPPSYSLWIYSTLLSPKPLRNLANRLIKSVTPSEIMINEGVVILNQSDVGVSGMLALGVYEPFETELFRRELRENMVVIDIGSNIGYYAIIAGARVGKEGKVFAYEPENENFLLLKKNILANKLTQVNIYKEAISDKEGVQQFYLTEDNKGTHSLVDNRNTRKSILVDTKTLDQSLAKHGSPKVDIIKMDIEGAEVLAIEGMKETILQSPNMAIFTEFYPNAIRRLKRDPIQFLETLTNFGFTLSIIDEDKKILIPLNNFKLFVENFTPGEKAKNIYAVKSTK